MGVKLNLYDRFNTYTSNIQRTYEHKVTYALIEKELFGKNTKDSITHDLDKLILFILGFPRKFISSIHRKHSEHHLESNKPLNLRSIVCDNIASSPYFKSDKHYSLRQYFENSPTLNKITGLKELLEKFNYGEDLNFEKIKNTVDTKYKGIKGIFRCFCAIIKSAQ